MFTFNVALILPLMLLGFVVIHIFYLVMLHCHIDYVAVVIWLFTRLYGYVAVVLPVIMDNLEKRPWFMRYPRMHMPFQTLMLGVS